MHKKQIEQNGGIVSFDNGAQVVLEFWIINEVFDVKEKHPPCSGLVCSCPSSKSFLKTIVRDPCFI